MDLSSTLLIILSLICLLIGFSSWKDSSLCFIGCGLLLAGTSDRVSGTIKISLMIIGSVCILISVTLMIRRIYKNKNMQKQ